MQNITTRLWQFIQHNIYLSYEHVVEYSEFAGKGKDLYGPMGATLNI